MAYQPTFWRQLKAILIRNFHLKTRDKGRTAAEVLMPLYFIIILVVIRNAVDEVVFEEITQPTGTTKVTDWWKNSSSENIAYTTEFDKEVNPQYIKDVLNSADAIIESFGGQKPRWTNYGDEDDMETKFSLDLSFSKAIVFGGDCSSKLPPYTIRIDEKVHPLPLEDNAKLYTDLGKCRDPFYDDTSSHQSLPRGTNCPSNDYYYSGFISLQQVIEIAIIRTCTGNDSIAVPEIQLQQFPKAKYIGNTEYLRSFVPLYLVLSFTPLVSCITVLIVDEKERKIREVMKMMGLRDPVYWIGWFLSYSFMVVYLALFISILLVLAKVMANSSIILIFFSTFLYGLSTITIAYIITTFFSKAKIAGGVAGIMSVLFSVLYYLAVYADGVNTSVYWFLSLISPTAFALGMDQAVYLDLVEGGLTFENVWVGKGSYSFGASLVMLTIDIFLYAFIAYYLDNVIPGEYGRKRPPWFCFLPSYWKGTGTKWCKTNARAQSASTNDVNIADCEEVPRQMIGKETIKILGLKKSYTTNDGKEFHAVNGMHLDIYEGQITAVLGHNGAGKSTLISMLVGLTSPTEGTAVVSGYDIRDRNNMEPIWQNMGVCLQQDTLFDVLTCREHLEFYARMKGMPSKKLCDRVEMLLAEVGLSDKADTKSIKLSGGQKRRLSVGIALIGEPKIVFLDEPSSGVDPYSRRQLWNLLQSKKQGRAIVLTTHFMDEADILADRKAIVSRGKLKCVGSSLFLKNRFGLGYHLSVVVDPRHNLSAIEKLVRESSARAKKVRETSAEITFVLPFEDVANFPQLLGALDQKISVVPNDLGIRTYGVSMTTLEEVFLELGKKEDEVNRAKHGNGKTTGSRRGSVCKPLSKEALRRGSLADIEGGLPSFPVKPSNWKAYAAVTKLRLTTTLRLPKSLIFTIVIPMIILILGFTLLKFQEVEPVTTSPFEFKPQLYAPPSLLYNNLSGVNVDPLLSSVAERMQFPPETYKKSHADLLENKPHIYYWQLEKFSETNHMMTVNVTYNDTAQHSLPVLVTLISNVLLDQLGSSDLTGVVSSGHPLPAHGVTPEFNMYAMMAGMLIGIVYILVSGFLAVDLVEDRESRIRHLLQVNGLRFISYWGSMMASHVAIYGITFIFMMVFLLAFQINELSHPAAIGTIFLIYSMYLMTGLLYAYCLSFIFDRTDRAQSLMPFLTMMLGYIPYTAMTTLDRLNPDAEDSIATMHYIFTALFPVYTPFAAIYFTNKVYVSKAIAGLDVTRSDYFTPPINAMLLAVPIQGLLLWCLLIILDVKSSGGKLREFLGIGSGRKKAQDNEGNYDVIENEDTDVKDERSRVLLLLNEPNNSRPPVVAMQALRKEYPVGGLNIKCKMPFKSKGKPSRPKMPKVAVRNLTLAVDRGEVFGLLGPNGAGKTTALSMIVADRGPTRGRITIAGKDASTGLSDAYSQVGFCPQHDALWKNITVREHIECYAAVRGVSKTDIPKLTDCMLKGLQIEEHANKRSHTLSGGTKRKLSYAISMIGCPKAVLLDEPSTGMDPQSKRFLWNTILASFHGDRGAVLTTHSMEEADVLCSRIGIMVKGALRCLGSTQHLKNKYGSGYILEAKLASGHSMVELEAFLTGLFKTAKLQEKFEDRVKYQIPPTEKMPLAKVFAELQQAKQTIGIQEYSFSQTTLEQVFLDFARQQEYD